MTTAEIESPRTQPFNGPDRGNIPSRPRRPWVTPAAFTVLGVLLFFVYLIQADKLPIFADGSSQALQAWDMLHGNPLLRGWVLSDVSFYTTELPQYLLIELVLGLSPAVVHVAGAMTYALLVVLVAVLAKGRATGREGLLRALIAVGIMLAPPFGRIYFSRGYSPAWILLSAPDHTGTQVPLVLTWLALERLRAKWWMPVLVGALLTWVEIADPTAIFEGAVPIAVVCAVRMYRRRGPFAGQRHDLSLAAAAIASAGAATGILALIKAAGGFAVNPASPILISVDGMTINFWVKVHSVLTVFGADFFGMSATSAFIPVAHLVAVVLVAWAVIRAGRLFFADDDLPTQVLTASFVLLLAEFMFGYRTGAREVVGLLPIGAVLAARMLPVRIFQLRLASLLAAVLACLCVSLVVNLFYPVLPSADSPLAAWLRAHHLTYGLSATWYSSNGVTLYSDGGVQVRDIEIHGGQIVPVPWNTQASWYNPRLHDATFIVFDPCAPTLTRSLYQNLGPPSATYFAEGFTVAVWKANLLTKLAGSPHGPPSGSAAGSASQAVAASPGSGGYLLMCGGG
jgi:hypothetical protein